MFQCVSVGSGKFDTAVAESPPDVAARNQVKQTCDKPSARRAEGRPPAARGSPAQPRTQHDGERGTHQAGERHGRRHRSFPGNKEQIKQIDVRSRAPPSAARSWMELLTQENLGSQV